MIITIIEKPNCMKIKEFNLNKVVIIINHAWACEIIFLLPRTLWMFVGTPKCHFSIDYGKAFYQSN